MTATDDTTSVPNATDDTATAPNTANDTATAPNATTHNGAAPTLNPTPGGTGHSTAAPAPSSAAATHPQVPSADAALMPHSVLASDHGSTAIADVVVAKIAALATREVTGVHDLGGGATRMAGVLRERIPGARVNVQQGVSVEIGEQHAAVDISVIAEYGVAIHELAAAIRKNVMVSVQAMTGLIVTEVNVTIHDIYFPDAPSAAAPAA